MESPRRGRTRRGEPGARRAKHAVVGEPGIGSFSARAVLLEADSRGLPTDGLLERNGLSREWVSDPDGWVPLRPYAAFYRDVVRESGDPAAFWVGVGGRALVQAAQVTGYAAAASSSVREALETWARLSGLVVDLVTYHLESTPQGDVFLARWPPAHASLFQDAHVSATVAFRHFVAYVAGPVIPVKVFLARPAPRSTDAVESALAAPVTWNAEWPCLAFPPGTFHSPLHFSDPDLRAMLVQKAERRLEMRSARRVSDRVRAAILEIGFDRSEKVAVVAEAIGTTTRTLQRWLQEESLTFSDLRGEVLGRAAARMLREDGVPVSAVAFRLGFSSRGTFHRAIRRWTGKTPSELRGTGRARRAR